MFWGCPFSTRKFSFNYQGVVNVRCRWLATHIRTETASSPMSFPTTAKYQPIFQDENIQLLDDHPSASHLKIPHGVSFHRKVRGFFWKKNLGTEGWYTHGLHRKPPCHVLIGWSRWPVLTLVRLLKFQCTNLLLHTVHTVLIPGAEPDYHLHRRQLSFHC